MSNNWVIDVVRCPQSSVHQPQHDDRISTNATTHAPSPTGNHTHDDGGGVEHLPSHMQQLYDATLADSAASTTTTFVTKNHSTGHSHHHHHVADNDIFPFASTTVLYGLVAIECLICCLYIIFRRNGVRFLMGTEDDEAKPMIEKKRDPSTDNRWWAVFFGSNFLCCTISAVALHIPHVDEETSRIIITVHRLFLGTACLILTMALNHQRIYKHQDMKLGQVSKSLKKQVVRMNKIVAGVFLLFCVSDFVASHIVVHGSTACTVLFWVYIIMLIGLAVPVCLCTAWVCFHKAEVEPSITAKRILFVAIFMHLVSMFPPSFWNLHVLSHFVSSHPCPMHFLSFYDIILCVEMIGKAFFFVFVVLEYNRNRLLRMAEHFNRVSAHLNTDQVISQVSILSSRENSEVSMPTRGPAGWKNKLINSGEENFS